MFFPLLLCIFLSLIVSDSLWVSRVGSGVSCSMGGANLLFVIALIRQLFRGFVVNTGLIVMYGCGGLLASRECSRSAEVGDVCSLKD